MQDCLECKERQKKVDKQTRIKKGAEEIVDSFMKKLNPDFQDHSFEYRKMDNKIYRIEIETPHGCSCCPPDFFANIDLPETQLEYPNLWINAFKQGKAKYELAD